MNLPQHRGEETGRRRRRLTKGSFLRRSHLAGRVLGGYREEPAGRVRQGAQRGLRLSKKALTPSCASGSSQASARAATVRSTVASSIAGPRLRARRFEAATAPGAQAR